MVFSIIIILLVGVVAFFHYVQGFFSATLSAMIAVIAATLAISYHENVVDLLLKGKMADYAHGMVLCILFATVYTVLRVIFDAAIPGNVRTPSIVDKVGAGLMGLIAGIFTVGTFAIAAQMLPFDPGMSFMGYSRYALTDTRLVAVPRGGGRQMLDSQINGEMADNSLDPDKEKGLLFPVDDWTLDTVYHLSDGGSLAGDRSLASIHPDYLQELFGQRLGIETGARRVALSASGEDPIDVGGLYTAASFPTRDGVVKEVRAAGYQPAYKNEVKSTRDQQILVIRVKVGGRASDDDDTLFRFSTGSIHLVGPSTSSGSNGGFKDYYPIGTLENAQTVLLNKPDDFLFVKSGDSFDAVFVVDGSVVVGGKCAPGTFLDVKRFGIVDLSGKTVQQQIPFDADVKMIRSPVLVAELKLPPAPEGPSSPTASNGQNTPSSQTQERIPTSLFTFLAPPGWVHVQPSDPTVSIQLVPAGGGGDGRMIRIKILVLTPGATARQFAESLVAGGTVSPSPIPLDGAETYHVTATHSAGQPLKTGFLAAKDGKVYTVIAVSKPDVDLSSDLNVIAQSWTWAAAPATPAAPEAPAAPVANKPIADDLSASVSNGFMTGSINIGTDATDRDAKDAAVPGGKITLINGEIAVASIDPTASLTQLSQGANQYNQFISQPNTTLVQLEMPLRTPSWDWLQQRGNIKLVDTNGNTYEANGFYAQVNAKDGKGLFLRYNYLHFISSIPAVNPPDGPPSGSVYFIFLVPSNTQLKSFTLGDKTQDLSAPVAVP